MAVPVAGNAFPGECRVNYDSVATCTFTAGIDKVLVVGESGTVAKAMEDVDTGLTASDPVGITLEGPGVSETWYRGAKVRELIDVTAGEDYELTVHITGSAAANSGYSQEDRNYAAYVTSADAAAAPGTNVFTVSRLGYTSIGDEGEEVIGCSFDWSITPNGSTKVRFSAAIVCTGPAEVANIWVGLYRGTTTASGQQKASETNDEAPYIPLETDGTPHRFEVAKDYTCGTTCKDYWTIDPNFQLTLSAGIYAPAFDPSGHCQLNLPIAIVECEYKYTRKI